MRNEIVKLVKLSPERDSDGYVISQTVVSSKEVFAKTKSVTRTEFYSAMHAGISAEIAFVVNDSEYDGENAVEYNGKMYHVIRTYSANTLDIELMCSDKAVKQNGGI